MTRIAYRRPEQMTERARELTLERGNLNVYRAVANAEKVYTGWMEAGSAALNSPVQHNDIAPTAGVTGHEIKALTSESGWEQIDLSDTERAVVGLTSELLTTRSVSAALFDEVHKVLGSEVTIEVLMVIGRYAGLALMLNALDVDLDESDRLTLPGASR
jgi:hypothetical protein